MRKQKTIKIDEREITVKELRVKDIRDIIAKSDNLVGGELDQIKDLLPLATDLASSEIEDMAPSELRTIWDAFREVNAVFFDLVAKTGIVELLKTSVLKDLTALFATLSEQATETPGNTDTLSS
ncbi:MAG: hypothetical protein JRC60_00220 [Deltaproteobacteria bacterium]|nr:hypothetical protein [Deltaproteobacteria bacterium]